MNRFEIIGIGFSVGIMALALWLLRVEMTNDTVAAEVAGNQVAAVVVAEDAADQQAAFSSAYQEASVGGELNKLIIDDITIGTGEPVEKGDVVTVHYRGMLQNGQEFENSRTTGQPFTFEVGAGRTIPGWEEGLIGMKEGGSRILVVPPHMAYGEDGYGPIPKNATLVFSIELIEVKK